ncbi:transposable element Tcb1 transposase [Trichonephila clavipes]|nr:transposable element Tcb1 transposase [Trichonephila clavipes]
MCFAFSSSSRTFTENSLKVLSCDQIPRTRPEREGVGTPLSKLPHHTNRKDSGLPRYCGLSFRKIGSRVGRNQTTVMRICDRWMQEGTTDRRGRSHLPQYTTSLSERTNRRRLQQRGLSARSPLFCVPLTQNHRRPRRQWCYERRMGAAEWNEIVFTDESCICLKHHDGRI